MTLLRTLLPLMALLLLPVGTSACLGQQTDGQLPRIFYSKEFPGSVPPYFEVTLDSCGQALYREAPDEEDPIAFAVSDSEISELFDLVAKLDYFRSSFASDRKVAFTGDKVLRYEGANGERHELRFVFTENAAARQLVTWFERVRETERHLIELERVAQFDRLGINKVLLAFQTSYDKDRIIAPKQFLPILRKVASGKKFVHIARARAASLVERIEASQ